MLVPDTIIVFLAINLILMDLVSRFLRESLSVRSAIQPSSSNQPARRGLREIGYCSCQKSPL